MSPLDLSHLKISTCTVYTVYTTHAAVSSWISLTEVVRDALSHYKKKQSDETGIPVSLVPKLRPQEKSLLYQEIQALVLKSRQLRKLNFENCLPRRRPRDNFDEEGGAYEKDPGCEIVAAIMPVCRTGLTEVTWIILNGIELGETDFDDLRTRFLSGCLFSITDIL